MKYLHANVHREHIRLSPYLQVNLQGLSHQVTKIKCAPFWWHSIINESKFTCLVISLYRPVADHKLKLGWLGDVAYLPTATDSEGPQRARSQDCWPRKAGLSDAADLGVDLPMTTGTRSSQAETLWLCGKCECVSQKLLLQWEVHVAGNISKLLTWLWGDLIFFEAQLLSGGSLNV